MKIFTHLTLLCLPLALACGDDGASVDPDGGVDTPDASAPDANDNGVPRTYDYESRFLPGESSVSYSGQVFRQVLIAELSTFIDGLSAEVDTNAPANDDDVLGALNFYFDFDGSTSGDLPVQLATSPAALQTTFNMIASGKDLRSKVAGNDAVTDHRVWNTPGNFVGWSEGGTASDTPTELIQYWFGLLDDQAFDRINGAPLDPDGAPIAQVYITAQGQDLKQLTQKFLLSSITFSQANDDYLDDDVDGKGLKSPNTQDGDSAHSVLEHAWDEGFGYFGAARNYNDFTDDEIAGKGGRDDFQGYNDADGDNQIDLLSEFNFGLSTNCAKRDRGSSSAAPTDFTKTAFDAFLAGRYIIASAGDALSAGELEDLVAQRDIISATWEACVSATVVHYINKVLADMATFETAGYDFEAHAKNWSELKGFALGLQFNPRSPMLVGTRFADFHALIGDAPVLPSDGGTAIDQYQVDLLAARAIAAEAYAFDQANVEIW